MTTSHKGEVPMHITEKGKKFSRKKINFYVRITYVEFFFKLIDYILFFKKWVLKNTYWIYYQGIIGNFRALQELYKEGQKRSPTATGRGANQQEQLCPQWTWFSRGVAVNESLTGTSCCRNDLPIPCFHHPRHLPICECCSSWSPFECPPHPLCLDT